MNKTIACLMFALSAFAAFGDTTNINGVVWTYTIYDGEATIRNTYQSAIPSSTIGTITIPSELGGYPVTSIGNCAFVDCCSLTSVSIPSSVTNIDVDAFYGCYSLIDFLVDQKNESYFSDSGVLISLDDECLICFPKGRTGEYEIPVGVTSVGEYAFEDCIGMTSIWMSENVQEIGHGAFCGCSGLTSVMIPDGIQEIDSYAFGYCINLTSVTIPEGVTRIGSGAFSGCCGLAFVTIPSSVTDISVNCMLFTQESEVIITASFDGCSAIREVSMPSTFKMSEIFPDAYDKIKKVVIPDGTMSITNGAFRGCSSLTAVTIPDSVTSIATNSFVGCPSVRDVTIPSTFVMSEVFPDAYKSIENVVIADGSSYVAENAFAECLALKSVEVPASVTWMEDKAFYKCAALRDVTFLGDAPWCIGDDVFTFTPRRLTFSVDDESIGWCDDFTTNLPPSWCGRQIVQGDVSSSGGGTTGGGTGVGAASAVTLTVTNVVVHYVLNSVRSDMAAPATSDVGLVNVIAEVKGGSVAIPESWAANYPGFASAFGSDFAAALTKPSGKRDAAGNAMCVWQDYVAGTDPTDAGDVFTASITIVDGKVKISYSPELTADETAKRKYVTWGKASLLDENWIEVPAGDEGNYNFFKVTVEMR